jgi:serine/threonine-protein kinase RsbW
MPPVRRDKSRLAIGNKVAELSRIVEFVDRFAKSNGIPKAIGNDLNLCLDELLNNTISYGYDDRARHSIVVDLAIADGVLIAEVTDDARPFDPRKATPAAVGDSLQSRMVGGLGLQFVKALADAMDYERVGQTNVVRITMRVRGDARDGDR